MVAPAFQPPEPEHIRSFCERWKVRELSVFGSVLTGRAAGFAGAGPVRAQNRAPTIGFERGQSRGGTAAPTGRTRLLVLD
ncbi:MAG: hypothetical protein ACK58T_23060, partial [Phycisphaerae bacterium]